MLAPSSPAASSTLRWGYRLLGLQILLIPIHYDVRELPVRLGPPGAWVTLTGITAASVGALLTEPSAVTELSFYRRA